MPGGTLARPASRPGLRTPARKPTEFGSRTQTPGPEIQKRRPGRRRGLRTPVRKVNKLGFRTQTLGPEIQKMRPGRPARFAYAYPQSQ